MPRQRKGVRLRSRPDTGTYEIVGHHPVTGRSLRISCGTRDIRQAEIQLAQFRAGLAKAPELAPAFVRPLLRDLLDQYATAMLDEDERRLKERQRREAEGEVFAEPFRPNISSPATLRQAVGHLQRHIGAVEPLQVSSGLVAQYAEHRRADQWTIPGTGVVRVGVRDSTIRRELAVLVCALSWAEAADNDGWFGGRGAPTFKHPVRPGNSCAYAASSAVHPDRGEDGRAAGGHHGA